MKKSITNAAIRGLYHTRLHRLFAALYAGVGSILMFHRISDPTVALFAPNRGLSVSSNFFEAFIKRILDQNIEIVDLDEARRRLLDRQFGRKFVCLTFDDGYRDNFEHAFPICRGLGVPMTIYVTTGFIDRTASCWWLGLERAIGILTTLNIKIGDSFQQFNCRTPREKQDTFNAISNLLGRVNEIAREGLCGQIAQVSGLGFMSETDKHFMTWDQVRELANSDTVTIAGHTVTHPQLARLNRDRALSEISSGCTVLAAQIGRPVIHFAYPFGRELDAGEREFQICRELGLSTAVTTRHAHLMPTHTQMLHALPRIGVSGWFQNVAAMEVMLSGATAALSNGFRRVVSN